MNARELKDLAKELKYLEIELRSKGVELKKLAEESEYLLMGSLTAIEAGIPVFDDGSEQCHVFQDDCFVQVLKKSRIKESEGQLPQTKALDASTKNHVALYQLLLMIEHQSKQLQIITEEEKLLFSQHMGKNRQLAELYVQKEEIEKQIENRRASVDLLAELSTKIKVVSHQLKELAQRQSKLEDRSLACKIEINSLKGSLPKLYSKIPEFNSGFARPKDRSPRALARDLGVRPARSLLFQASNNKRNQRLEVIETKISQVEIIEARIRQNVETLMKIELFRVDYFNLSNRYSWFAKQQTDLELSPYRDSYASEILWLSHNKNQIETVLRDLEPKRIKAIETQKTIVSELLKDRELLMPGIGFLSAESKVFVGAFFKDTLDLSSFLKANKEGELSLSGSSSSTSPSAISSSSSSASPPAMSSSSSSILPPAMSSSSSSILPPAISSSSSSTSPPAMSSSSSSASPSAMSSSSSSTASALDEVLAFFSAVGSDNSATLLGGGLSAFPSPQFGLRSSSLTAATSLSPLPGSSPSQSILSSSNLTAASSLSRMLFGQSSDAQANSIHEPTLRMASPPSTEETSGEASPTVERRGRGKRPRGSED